MASKPQPQPKNIVCSECGMSWEKHKPAKGAVELSECVRLLKEELARRPYINTSATWVHPMGTYTSQS